MANDDVAIRAIVAAKGEKILSAPLPIKVSLREQAKQDSNIAPAFDKPNALALALCAAEDKTIRTLVDLGAMPLSSPRGSFYPNMLFVATALGRDSILAEWTYSYRPAAFSREFPISGWVLDRRQLKTLLHVACDHGQSACARVLLNAGLLAGLDKDIWPDLLLRAQFSGDRESYALIEAAIQELSAKKNDAEYEPMPVPSVAASLELSPNGWHVIDDTRVAKVTQAAALGYCLTDIFNFATGEVLHLSRNLASNVETATTTAFRDFTYHDALKEAAACLNRPFDPLQLPPAAHTAKIVIKKRQ